jgi:V/A-type H+-transporting ATPase subunit K
MYSILFLVSAVFATVCTGLYYNIRSPRRGVSVTKARLILLGFMIFLFVMLCVSAIPVLGAETAETASSANAYRFIGASLAVGLACVGAGIAVGYVGAAACGIIGEKPDMLGKTLIYLGLAEGIAVYGIVISILILLI